MLLRPKRRGNYLLGLLVGLSCLCCTQWCAATGSWSVLPLAKATDDSISFQALAVGVDGSLYVADASEGHRILKRDAGGDWTVIATEGTWPGQVMQPSALAVDAAGTLYVAESFFDFSIIAARIQKRDARGTWSVLAAEVGSVGQIFVPSHLAVDGDGNLYVGESCFTLTGFEYRVRKQDDQGNWSTLGAFHQPASQSFTGGLAVDAAGNLYVAASGQLEQRDVEGNWTTAARQGSGVGEVDDPYAVAVDNAGSLYVADHDAAGTCRIQMRDMEGNWSVIAPAGSAVGQVTDPFSLAVDPVGNLYVADTGNHRVQVYLANDSPASPD